MNDNESIERLKTSKKPVSSSHMNLQKAIELGEYDPKFLSGFAEWHTLSRHAQFQYIRAALDNRRKHLIGQWAEINNVLDFSKKPYLQEALRNIEEQLRKLREDKERLYIEYSKV
ncbi:hypothetical protein HYW54_04460 [Candidatus Gottesmanbacteria bacterium]|nr:hypothetical protein [Candidatus Gottesmanbacteria bacterium]